MISIGEHQELSIWVYLENNTSVIATKSAFGKGSLFRETTLSLMQIIFECGLSSLKKLVACLKQESMNDADTKKKHLKACS